jgi:hypothetical protein
LPEQTNLIDAAIAAGVSRFLPADFGGDLTSPHLRTLIISRDKVATEEYLQKHESRISHTSIRTGPLIDWLLSRGVLVNMKDRSVTLHDSGDKRFSATTLTTAAAAVVAVLKMGTESQNRAFKVHEIVTSQNQLLKLAKEILPGVEWIINSASTAEMTSKSNELLKADPNSRMGLQLQQAVTIFGPQYNSVFEEPDNADLGIPMMDETQVKELLKTFA